MGPIYKTLEFLVDHRWARELLYWGGWCVVVYNTYSLPALTYAMTLLGALVMYFAGLVSGTAMTEKQYGGRT
jgi:hypothetical protein